MRTIGQTAEPKFDSGDFVRRRSNVDLAGTIHSREWDEQAESWTYRVRFGSGLRGVVEHDLELVPDTSGPWEEFGRNRFASADAFKELMTYERLRKPPNRIANSFGSAKAAFYPYQFKPLLKFLESPDQRILIADDVGLGKTIEAGYILRELRVRHAIERALIVVPARLLTKWKMELERRFEELFEIVAGREIIDLGRQLEAGRELKPFRWIVSYESARDRGAIELLAEYQPPIDIVIFDEAHRMRNRSTLQSQLGRALGSSADAVVMLSATPMQTGIENLFTLFQIMDPDGFSDLEVFISQMDANRPIVRALNAVRSHPVDATSIVNELKSLRSNPFSESLTRGDYFESLLTRSAGADQLPASQLVELQRDISELSLTGYMLSRTRKADVLKNRPTRVATPCNVSLTPAERAFYDAVAGLCRLVQPDLSGWGLAMSTLMAFRYTASCIPAALDYFRARLAESGARWWEGLPVEEEGQTREGVGAVAEDLPLEVRIEQELAGILSSYGETHLPDTKFATFKEAIEGVWLDDRRSNREERKIIVFSFFKRTLRYLSAQLDSLRIGHQLITGDISIPEREHRIDKFASDTTSKVLLSSEVGSEGLDLQFASVVVNYDLPWNPMVVEQRIGRIDRIGQKANLITILNLVVEDTVEDRILLRLYDRIGLFRDTIGELDPILGQKFEKLTTAAVRGDLTPEEQERQTDAAVRAIVEQEQQARHIEREADALMAADQAFLDEVNAMIGQRRTPGPEELYRFLHVFLQRRYPGSSISTTAVNGVGDLRLDPNAVNEIRNTRGASPEAQRLIRLLGTGRARVTFDQNTALDHASVELLHARHTLVLFAFDETRRNHDQLHRAFAMRLDAAAAPKDLIPGMYAFDIRLLDINGIRPRTELVPIFQELESGRLIVDDDAEQFLRAMLEQCVDVPAEPSIEETYVNDMQHSFDNHAREHRGRVWQREEQLNRARSERRRATLDATLGNRVKKARRRLEELKDRGAAEFAVRMQQRKLEIATREQAGRLAELKVGERLAVEYEEIAAGLVLVH